MGRRVVKKIPKGKGKPPVKVIRKDRTLLKKKRYRDMSEAEFNKWMSDVSSGMGENVERPAPTPPPKKKKKHYRGEQLQKVFKR